MSARGRGRANPNQDADEERRLWKEIKDKASEVDGMVVSHSLGESKPYMGMMWPFIVRFDNRFLDLQEQYDECAGNT